MLEFLMQVLELREKARRNYVHSLFMTGELRGTSPIFRETLLNELKD